ncbi:MAG: glucuronoxylanase XynC, partial [Verrucomicrobiota bacterium]
QTGTPVTSIVDAFQPEGTHGFSYSGGKIGSVWSNWFGGAFQSLSWDSTTDADANTASGSMKILANFSSTNNQFTVINGFNGISPSVSARQFTALECDVKFGAGSATYLNGGVQTFGRVEFGMATPSYGQLYFGGMYIPATETGWVHVTIPLNPATNPNLLKIKNVMVHIWGGTSLVGASTLWVDNLKFTGTTVSDTATANYAVGRQLIDGFGASSAWGSSWSTADADLFFSTGPNGAGLSLLRTRIAPDGTTVEANLMKMARDRGARVWSTPWSPPSNLKTSNSWNGGSFISSPANYQTYANQLANYVLAMKTTHGVNLHAVSIQNEPNYETDYESCLWSAAQFHEFVPYLSTALTAKGVGGTKIMLPESAQWNFSLAADTMNDPATAAQVGILGGHNYGSSASAVTQFGSPAPVPLWQTEHYFGASADVSITNGLAVAEQIHDFMTVAEASAYHYWWLKGSGSGSIAGNSTTNPAKRLYVMGNYSKFVRPGFQRFTVTSNTTALISAYKNPASQDFVIVAANPTAWPVTQTFNLASCPTVTSLDRWVTSDALSLSSQAAVSVTAGVFTAVLPAFTVTTYQSVAATSPVIALQADDAFGASSFNTIGHWNDIVAPTLAKEYTAAQFDLRTPPTAGNYTFGGHSLTLPPSSTLKFKGGNNDTITIANLTLDGGWIENGNGNTSFTLAGSISVAADSILYPANDATRTIHISAELDGTGVLTCGNGGVGTVSFGGANDSFTGAVIVNGGSTLKVGSPSNLGGNPVAFNAGLLTLDNGIFQPTAGFEMNRSNGGVTLGTGGGTFSINSGIALAIANPVTGTGSLTKTGPGELLLNGPNSHGGTTTVSAGTLKVSGLGGTGAVVVGSGTTLGGTGVIAGNATINGTLAPSAPGMTLSGSLGFGSTGKASWGLSGNSSESAATVIATAVSVTAGAKVDVLLNNPGSTTNFLHSFWRTSRTFPVITASPMTGSFALGSITTDAGGRPVATYGAFSLQNSGTGVNLVWTPIPGFPSVDDPTVALTSPSANSVSVPSNTLSLRVSASVTGGSGTTLAWSQVSGPGVATFADPAASDTQVSFPADGIYILRCTVTNAVGIIYQNLTVLVAPSSSLTLREGVNEYSHAATLIRSDLPTMNSGTRDQVIVGRNGGALRGLFSFDVSQIPVGATINSVTLDLWAVSAGSGTSLNTLELHKLLTNFIEGTGDGSNAANGAGTGADWPTRTGNAADPWTAAGGAPGADYEAATLATLPGFNPTTAPVGTQYTFGSSPALVSEVGDVAGTAAPLGLMLKMVNDTTGSNVFARFGSDNHATLAQRPRLTIGYSLDQTPSLATGTAPAAQTGVAAALTGSTTNATNSLWSLVSGPGTATFGNPLQSATTVTFSHPGTYLLRLSAANTFGETSSTLVVGVQDLTPPVITVPANMTAEATSAAGAVVNFSTSAVDAVSGTLATTGTPASGSTFPLGTTTVTVTASDAASNPASATFTITVTPAVMSFDSWTAGIFNEAELADESISGPYATPANDGLTNLLKYALGLPPKTPSTTGVQLARSGESLTFIYQRPAERADISYRVEVSTGLDVDSWSASGVGHVRLAEGDPESWQGTYTPGAGDERVFFRLHVGKP